MKESINPVFHAKVVIECITVKVAKFRDIPLYGRALKGYNNIGFHKNSASENDKVLKTLYKEQNIPIIDVFLYQNYLTFFVCLIKIGVKVAQVGLISSLYCGLL